MLLDSNNSGNSCNSRVCNSSTNNRGMVNNMVGGVGGGVSLDRNLRDLMDLMVDSNTNLVNNRCSSHNNWGSMSISDWSSMGNSRGSNSMSSRVNTSYETMTKPKAMSISKNL